MALALFDRVQETSTTAGTGSIVLAGAVSGFQSFAVVGNGNTCYYTIVDGSAWEVGVGTYSTSGPTLARTTILSNSNGNTSPLTLTANSKSVFLTYPAGKSVNLNESGNVSPLGTVVSGIWNGTTIGVAYGGTGVTASSGANSVVLRDANQNVAVNRVNQSNTNTTAAGGTTALTAASSYIHTLVGTGGQTYSLPDATTLTTGVAFVFNNLATGTLTLANYAGTTIGTIPSGGAGASFLTLNSTTGGTWDLHAYLPEGVTFGTNAFNLGSSIISGGTWQGGTIQTGYGGTGLTTYTSGGAVYANSSSTLTSGTLPITAGGTGNTSGNATGLVDDSSWMKSRGSVATASIDTATANGFYTQNNVGDSQGLLVFNAGGSLGPLQMTFTYAGLFQFRNKTDSATWTAFKTVLTDINYNSYAPTLTGTGASGTWGINITGNAATATTAANYLPLAGGTLTGQLVIGAAGTAGSPTLRLNTSTSSAFVHTQESFAANLTSGQHIISVIGKVGNTKNSGYIGYTWAGDASNSNYVTIGHWGNDDLFRVYADGNVTVGTSTVLNASNYTSYAPTLTGTGATGTWGISVTGTANNITAYTINQNLGTGNQVTFDSVVTGNNGNGTNFRLGDDAWIGDVNIANTTRLQGVQSAANGYLIFGNGDNTALGRAGTGALTYGGNAVLTAANYNSYAPTLTGGGASGTWGINVTGSAGSSSYATYIYSQDIRTLSPSSTSAYRMGFGFTSWANNNSAPYADYLALRSYSDASGGNDNLVMFNKSTIAMRVWQQSFGSASAYSSYADVLMSNNYNSYAPTLTGGGASGTWSINITGSAGSAPGYLPLSGGTMTGSVSFAQGANINFGTTTTESGPWTISVIGSGGATPATKGTGYGRNLIVKAGNSDNGGGLAGGDLYLRAGAPTAPATTYGVVYLSDDGGYTQAGGSLRAPIFYDSNDTGYYLNPNGTSNLFGPITVSGPNTSGSPLLNLLPSGNGAFQRGVRMLNAGMTGGDSLMYAVGIADNARNMGQFYFVYSGSGSTSNRVSMGLHSVDDVLNIFGTGNTSFGTTTDSGYRLNISGTGYATSDFRAPIFYDSNNTGYYVDPASTSNLVGLTVANTISGSINGNASNASNADALNGISAVGLFNNMGQAHGTRTSFDASTPSYGFGYRYVQGSTNGPNTGGTQYYSWYIGLGSEYPATGAGSYGAMFAVDRDRAVPYMSVRYNEGNSFSSWRKVAAGYADSAGSADYNGLSNKGGGTGTYTTSGDYRAPIFYDSNNTAYYGDFENISSMYGIAVRGDTSASDSRNQIFFWGAGDTTTSAIGFKANGGEFPNPTGFGDGYNTYLTMDTDGRGWVFRRGVGGSDFNSAYTSGWILNNGVWQANASMRAPIFYDSNDTNYYVNPADGGFVLKNNVVTFFTNNSGFKVTNAEGNGVADVRLGAAWGAPGVYSSTSFYVMSENSVYWKIANSDKGYIDSSANLFAFGSMRSPIFYDSNDTAYYLDPTGTSVLNVLSNPALSDSRLYLRTRGDTNHYLWNAGDDWEELVAYSGTGFRVSNSNGAGAILTCYGTDSGNYVQARGSMRAPLFYDSDNTAYYVDPAGTSVFRPGSAYANITDLGNTAPIQVAETQTGTGATRYIPMISQTSTSSSGYRQHTVFGSVRATVWGSAFIAVGGNDSYPTVAFTFNYGGDFTSPGNVTAYSDERLKTNWRAMPENFVSRLAQVKVGIYDRQDLATKPTQVGVGAQSLQTLLPQAVNKADDEMGTLSVSYGNAALASAVELAKYVTALEQRISQLEARL